MSGLAAIAIAIALVTAVAPVPAAAAPVATAMVSIDASGAVAGDESSRQSSVSADGRFVAFASKATNLTNVLTGGFEQVYVRDMVSGTTELVTIDGVGGGAGNSDSTNPSISGDGRFVAFESTATNLESVPAATTGIRQVYLRDLDGAAVRLVSVNSSSTGGGDAESSTPDISATGDAVAFTSEATDLVAGVVSKAAQIYRWSLSGTAMASVRSSDLSTGAGDPGDGASHDASISADGRVISFTSAATNLTWEPLAGPQVFAHLVDTGETRLVSRSRTGRGGADGFADQSSISGDGSRVVFRASARNLDPVVGNDVAQIYLRDLADLDTPSTVISLNRSGRSCGDIASTHPSISADGRIVAFVSSAMNLATSQSNGIDQVYVRNLETRSTRLVSESYRDPRNGPRTGQARLPQVSGDGKVVTFESEGNGLVNVDNPAYLSQIYVRGLPWPAVDRLAGADRFAASAEISRAHFGSSRPVAYVASGSVFADALSASAAAGDQGAPVLLVTKDSIPSAVATELVRLAPWKIVVVGGTATVSQAVQDALGAYSSSVVRIGGADRFAVSAALSSQSFASRLSVAYVASGLVFSDALSGSAAAGRDGGPVLLATRDDVPSVIRAELTRLEPQRIVVLGGANTISHGVVAALAGLAPTERITGADRYVLSAAVAATFRPEIGTVYIASGAGFPDALSGSAAAISRNAPVLLVTKDGIPPSVAAELDRLDPRRIVVLGGVDTVSDAVATDLVRYLDG